MHHKHSEIQPFLNKTDDLVRFKGCYRLQSTKVRRTNSGWPTRIASIMDIECGASLEVRLLGECNYSLNLVVGQFIYLECAYKHSHEFDYFYLVWFECVTERLNCIDLLDLLPPQTSIESLLRISTRKLSDAEICVELSEVSYRYHDKIEDLGFILCKLDDPEIFLLWENMLLGSR